MKKHEPTMNNPAHNNRNTARDEPSDRSYQQPHCSCAQSCCCCVVYACVCVRVCYVLQFAQSFMRALMSHRVRQMLAARYTRLPMK